MASSSTITPHRTPARSKPHSKGHHQPPQRAVLSSLADSTTRKTLVDLGYKIVSRDQQTRQRRSERFNEQKLINADPSSRARIPIEPGSKPTKSAHTDVRFRPDC